MKAQNKLALLGAGVGAALLWLIKKNKSVSGIGDLTTWNKRHLADYFDRDMWDGEVVVNLGVEDSRGNVPVDFYPDAQSQFAAWTYLVSKNNLAYLKELCRIYHCDYREIVDRRAYYPNVSPVFGIGATKQKRRIWSEVEQAQRAGIDLSDPNGWTKHADRLSTMSKGKLSSSRSDKPDAQRYFNQLRRAYKSVAGTNLPYDESVVRNENDDVILVYRDYHLDRLPQVAAEWVSQEATENVHNDPLAYGYWVTIAAIAIGSAKFIWKGTKNGVHRGVEELVFGSAAPTECKKRISYIVSPNTRDKYPKGAAAAGKYPEEWAHALWEGANMSADDQEITNGVYEALRTCESVGQARQMCIDEYLKAHQVEEPLLYQDVPF